MGELFRIVFCSLLIVTVTIAEAGAAEQSQSQGRLTAGVSFDIPGMGYKNPNTGAIEGFEPNVARAVAEKLFGVADRVDFVQVSDKQRITSLQDRLVDMVIAQLTITPERADKVDFTVPYYFTKEGLLAPKESGIRGVEDLKGKRIAVTAGSASLQNMRAELPSLAGATLVIAPTSSETVEAVAKGEADAASNDLIDLKFLRNAAENPAQYKLIDIGSNFEPKPFGIAVKKGNRALVDRLNKAIESLKSNGDVDRLLNEAIAGVGP